MFRVLLVDDDESLRQLLVHRFSDYNMPDGNGSVLQNYLVNNNIKSFLFFYTSEANVEINPSHTSFLGLIEKPQCQKL